jgi:hypothetical protein
MESMRATWTDERLDDLTHRIDDGFDRVDKDLRDLRHEMREEFASVRTEMRAEFASVRGDSNQQAGSLREEMQAMGSEINARFDSLQRAMIQFGGSMIVAFVGLIIAVVLRGA